VDHGVDLGCSRLELELELELDLGWTFCRHFVGEKARENELTLLELFQY
jgi:hypothetical protein